MQTSTKIGVIVLLALAVGLAVGAKTWKANKQQKPAAPIAVTEPAPASQSEVELPSKPQQQAVEVKPVEKTTPVEKKQETVRKDPPKPVVKQTKAAVVDKPIVPKAVAVKKPAEPAKPAALPKLLDLGSDKCIPCKKMAPILDELKTDYKGKLEVVFIDVWKDQSAGEKYGIEMIPTQIFFDAEGKEIYRHVGFYPKEDILAKFSELGIDLEK